MLESAPHICALECTHTALGPPPAPRADINVHLHRLKSKLPPFPEGSVEVGADPSQRAVPGGGQDSTPLIPTTLVASEPIPALMAISSFRFG